MRHAMAALALGAVLCAPPAPAQQIVVDGVAVADHAVVAGRGLVLNGAGPRTILGFHVYVAALYLPERMHSAADVLGHDLPRRMQITLLRDVSTEQNLDVLKGGLIANNSAAEIAAIDAEVRQFFALLGQVHALPAGTAIQFDYLPGQGTRLRVAERELGLIPGARFHLAVLRIWLGEDPIQLSLKKALLGQEQPT